MFAAKFKRIFLYLIIMLHLFLIAGCGDAALGHEHLQLAQPPGAPPPGIFVNGKVYIICSITPGRTRNVLDNHFYDYFSFVGEVKYFVPGVFVNANNFQANTDIVGARLYLYDDELIAEIRGVYRLYRLVESEYD